MREVQTKFARSLFASDIPSDWQLVTVGELLQGSEYGLNEPGDIEGDIPIVGMKNIEGGFVRFDDLGNVNRNGRDWSKLYLKAGDILLNRTNSPDLVGKVGIVREDTETVFASYLVRLIADRECVNPEFLNYWLNTSIAQKALKRLSTRAISQANINPTEFRKYCPVPLPNLPEQGRLAEVLRAWDDALQNASDLLSLKERRQSAFSRQYFLPCHVGGMPGLSGWSMFALEDLFAERTENGQSEDRLLSITMADGVIDRDKVGRKDTSTEDKSKYKLILPGDIGYNTMRMWQGVSGLSALRGIVSPAYTIVTPRTSLIDPAYAAHLFKSRRMIFDFERYSQGLTSDTWNLKYPAFSKIKIWLPPMETQKKHASVMEMATREIRLLRKQIEQYSVQKRGLMQKLLTGVWRVNGEVRDG